jgi:F420H(2)-dependent quinone reductase
VIYGQRGDDYLVVAANDGSDTPLWQEMIGRWPAYEEYQRKANREIPVVVLERR